MNYRNIMVFAYGLLLLIGGIIGHFKAGSNASLIMGGISAVIAIGSSIAMFKKYLFGETVALVLSFILTLFFAYRFYLTLKFMPPGFMGIISLIVFGVLFSTKKLPQKK